MNNRNSALKVAIVGCGNISKVHLRFILQRIDVRNVALCDNDELRMKEAAKNWGITNLFCSLDGLLADFRPHVVHILTPPSTHKGIALQCIAAGAHVFIEKPMCISSAEASEIIAAAGQQKKLVCIDHMRLYDPLFLKAKSMIDSGLIGKLTNVSAEYSYDYLKRIGIDPAARWISKLPGGAFFDLIPHPLCLIEDLLPGIKHEVTKVYRDQRGVVTDLWSLFSNSQATASLHLSMNVYPLVNFIDFQGEQGIIRVDLRNFLFLFRKSSGLPNPIERIVGNLGSAFQTLGSTCASIVGFVRGKLDPYAGMGVIIERFYSAILCGSSVPVPGEKAKRIVDLTEHMFSDNPFVEQLSDSINPHLVPDVLVTGGTGFIGKRLVDRLTGEGSVVRVLTHRRFNEEEFKKAYRDHHRVQVVYGDVYRKEDVEKSCQGIATVYHLAAAMKGDWNYHLDTTVSGTTNVCKACDKMNVKHLIYASTLNVYKASAYPNQIIDESFNYEDKPENRGAYSHAKLMAEAIVREYQVKNKFRVTIMRPGLVYGPGSKGLPGDVGIRMGRKFLLVIGLGFRKLPLVYVDNLIDAFLLARTAGENGRGIFNVVDREYPSQRAYIRAYKTSAKERFISIYIPFHLFILVFWIIEKAVKLFFKKSVHITYKLLSVKMSPVHSTAHIEKSLGWSQKIAFLEGLARTVEGNKC
ncbi:MAG: Inositol 2-dehydrogenase [Pelotomaculum sp. PtaU1.Bin065]|nr:MAG: Inositol 2-dehydrogenase [Pelotomaculum sp. PtaU1.Bin065]